VGIETTVHMSGRTTRSRALLLAAAVAALTAIATPAQGQLGKWGPARPTPPAPLLPDVKLSNERTSSHWAYPTRRAEVRVAPRVDARSTGLLRIVTEDGYPNVYLLLSQHQAANGELWVHIRVPGRPNGRTGWVPREAVGAYHLVRTMLLIDRRTLRATLYKRGRAIFHARVGVGKPSTPTPGGRFWVREKFQVRTHTGLYGPRAIGTSAYAPGLTDWPKGGVVGLHGTGQPQLIPGRPSHGCIRMRNADITRLYRHLPLGTPIRVR
jgi:hypothetical protein